MTSTYNFARGDQVWDVIDKKQRQVLNVIGNLVQFTGGNNQWDHNLVILSAARESVPAIVAILLDGRYQPATRPHVHSDVGKAVTEAQRLAKKHPGFDFGTFVLKNISSSAEPVVTTRAA